MSVIFQYLYTVMDSLKFKNITNAKRDRIVSILGQIVINTDTENLECKIAATDIAKNLGMSAATVSRELRFLEEMYVLERVNKLNHKQMNLTPDKLMESSTLDVVMYDDQSKNNKPRQNYKFGQNPSMSPGSHNVVQFPSLRYKAKNEANKLYKQNKQEQLKML